MTDKPFTQKHTKSDEELSNQISDILSFESFKEHAAITVLAENGFVTLRGKIDSYKNRKVAEAVAKTVEGVEAIDDQMEVDHIGHYIDDMSVTQQISACFESNWAIPKERITFIFRNGTLLLCGDVEWHFQRFATELAASAIAEVKDIVNQITIRSKTISTKEDSGRFYGFYF